MIARLTWLLIAAGALAGLAGLNLLAFRYFWYWRIWWFDLLMHASGGAVVAIIASVALSVWSEPAGAGRFRLVAGPIIAVLAVSLGWELFEFTLDQSVRLHVDWKTFTAWQLGWWDTLGDISSALLGAAGGGALYRRFSPPPVAILDQSSHYDFP